MSDCRERCRQITASVPAAPSSTSRLSGREIRPRRNNGSLRPACMLMTVASPLARRLRDHDAARRRAGSAPFGSVSDSTRPTSLPLSLTSSPQEMGDGAADIGIARRRRIDELRFEVRSLHGHEVPGVGAAERAVHALALLQNGIGDLDRAAHRLAAHRVEGAEADRDRGMRRNRRAFERNRRQARACRGISQASHRRKCR